MPDFKVKMHQIRFRLGLCPRPRWRTRPPSWIKGSYFYGERSGVRGGDKVRRGREERGEEGRREGEGRPPMLDTR